MLEAVSETRAESSVPPEPVAEAIVPKPPAREREIRWAPRFGEDRICRDEDIAPSRVKGACLAPRPRVAAAPDDGARPDPGGILRVDRGRGEGVSTLFGFEREDDVDELRRKGIGDFPEPRRYARSRSPRRRFPAVGASLPGGVTSTTGSGALSTPSRPPSSLVAPLPSFVRVTRAREGLATPSDIRGLSRAGRRAPRESRHRPRRREVLGFAPRRRRR